MPSARHCQYTLILPLPSTKSTRTYEHLIPPPKVLLGAYDQEALGKLQKEAKYLEATEIAAGKKGRCSRQTIRSDPSGQRERTGFPRLRCPRTPKGTNDKMRCIIHHSDIRLLLFKKCIGQRAKAFSQDSQHRMQVPVF